jgi:hypothetical protein
MACVAEIAWELVENSPYAINRYRSATVALNYFGDSIANSIGDLISCVLGFWIAFKYPWKLTLVLYLVMELVMLVTIRDSLTLNVIMLLYPFEFIKQWQIGHP